MNRSRRVLLGLLIAYSASMTLLACRRSAEALLYRRIRENFLRAGDREPSSAFPLREFARDFGLDLTQIEVWSLSIADLQGPILVPSIVAFFLLGLGAALFRIPSRSRPEKD